MKKNLFAALFASVFMFSAAANAAVDAAQAEAFVEKVTREGIEEIINANVSQTVKDQRFEKLFNNALDLNFIGQFVLGRYWRTSTPEQKKGFINAYRELNIKTWSKRFDEFKGKKFVFRYQLRAEGEDNLLRLVQRDDAVEVCHCIEVFAQEA
mgnify:FL=1